MKYDVVGSNSVSGLAEEVNKRLADGWEPVGGIHSVTLPQAAAGRPQSVPDVKVFFYQSIIKKPIRNSFAPEMRLPE